MGLKVNDSLDLFLLYELTTFYDNSDEETEIQWNGLKIGDEDDCETVSIPECSYLGDTLICLSDKYENCEFDCLFIQELIRLYKENKLIIKRNPNVS